MAGVRELRKSLDVLKGERSKTESNLAACKLKLRELRKEKRWVEKALIIVQEVGNLTQQEIQIQVSDLGTSCIQTVFDEAIELVVDFVVRRGKTEADIFFLENDFKRDPLYGGGFGLADIGSFSLRTAEWGLEKNSIRNVMILDEPFKHLKDESKVFQDRARRLMNDLSKELGLQFIIIDHDPSITKDADKTFVVVKRRKRSIVTSTSDD